VISILAACFGVLILVNFGHQVRQLSHLDAALQFMYTTSLLSTNSNLVSLLSQVRASKHRTNVYTRTLVAFGSSRGTHMEPE
jgi:hypothetical protein